MRRPIARPSWFPRSGGKGGQGRLVGEDPFALLDALKDVIGEHLQFEAQVPHPLRHQRPAEFNAIAQIDRLLPVKRKAVGVFRHGDIGEQPLRRQAAFNDVRRRQSLDHAVTAPESVFGTARDDDPELRRHDVQPLGSILADQNLFQPLAVARDFRLDNFLDAFEMSCKTLAWTRCALWLALDRVIEFAADRRKAGLELFEGKGGLLVVDG